MSGQLKLLYACMHGCTVCMWGRELHFTANFFFCTENVLRVCARAQFWGNRPCESTFYHIYFFWLQRLSVSQHNFFNSLSQPTPYPLEFSLKFFSFPMLCFLPLSLLWLNPADHSVTSWPVPLALPAPGAPVLGVHRPHCSCVATLQLTFSQQVCAGAPWPLTPTASTPVAAVAGQGCTVVTKVACLPPTHARTHPCRLTSLSGHKDSMRLTRVGIETITAPCVIVHG